MSVHGNIKSSNVMINIDFSACLSDYGFTQLAERLEVYGASQTKPPSLSEYIYNEDLSQKSDLFDFGVVVMDILAGSRFPWLKTKCILENKEDIKEGKIEFFEFTVEGKERKRAMQVLDIALACTNRLPEARPSIEQVLLFLGDVINK